MIKAMCRLSCSICDKSTEEQGNENMRRRNRFRHIEQLKGHLFHQHRMFMCSLCLEGRKIFISEQKLYTRSQLQQHIHTGDSEVDGSESERGGFMGHPMCEFCRNPFYGDNELYMHMSTEHYTCHICQRQHPGQYDYFRNYDDLETHFRQEHFLCEDEACLAKKFVVFQSDAEMKRHNTIEHGGHMSRSKRNAALQIPTSFRYRRGNDQDQRRGRGRGFRPDPSSNELSTAIQASLETAAADVRARESSSIAQPVSDPGSDAAPSSLAANRQSSRNAHILDESYFPPLSDREPPEPSSRYAQALSLRSSARLGEELFPPLPGVRENNKSKQAEGSGSSTLASRLNRKKGTVKVLNTAQTKPSGTQHLGPSNSASFPELRPMIQNQGSTSSTTNSKPQAKVSKAAKASSSVRGNGFSTPPPGNVAWNSVSGNNSMRHSSSAPNLVDAQRPTPISNPVSATVGNQVLPRVEDVHTANKSLVERIRIGLGNDEERYAAFRSISAEYRQGQMNTWEYISYVEQFGLMHLVPELARLLPDPQKQKELIDAYNTNVRNQAVQENGVLDAGSSRESKQRKKKGKGKGIDHADYPKGKEELADNFLDTVRKLQLNQKAQGEEVEVLLKDGYRKANSISSSSVNLSSSSGESLLGAMSSGKSSKPHGKTSKFHRSRLGDNSPAALLNLGRPNATSPEHRVEESSDRPPEGLPVRGVWKSNGAQQLFSKK
ncbi:uncharacterized protein A4U43_C07F11070 [Asparagus officinalis]|uniref:C2H2-type domain-containing protein n=2 Tax=Asparagus officinalis TaxID=4686 RepID=A0A5P1ECY6_ASPOF|nr:uncharacterized protein A4U43_C07F11070 [Asparagus officinalis]